MRLPLAAIVLCGFAVCATADDHASDDEMRVVNLVVDTYIEEAQTFWSNVHRKNSTTMRGEAKDVRPSRLAISLTTIRPLAKVGFRYGYEGAPIDDRFDALRRSKSPLYIRYTLSRAGERLR